MMPDLMRYVRPTPQLPPPRKLSMSKDRLRRFGACFAGFLLLLAIVKASRHSRKYNIHILAPEPLKQFPADVRNVVARAAALARAELEQTGFDEESAVAKSAKDTKDIADTTNTTDTTSSSAEEDKSSNDNSNSGPLDEEPFVAKSSRQFPVLVERHLIDASHVGDEESASSNSNAGQAEKKISADDQGLTEAVTVKVKVEDDEREHLNGDESKVAGDDDEGDEGGGEENGISRSAKMAGERETEENHNVDDDEARPVGKKNGKPTSDDKEEEEGSNGDDENDDKETNNNGADNNNDNDKDNGVRATANISGEASSDIHGDSVAKDGDGESGAPKGVLSNFNYSDDTDVDYFGGLRARDAPERARVDNGGPDERLSTRDFGAIFGLAIAHSAVVSRSERFRLSKHDITLDEQYERLRRSGELVQLIEKYADTLENAAAGGEESLVYVRKANAGYGLFAARSLPAGTVLGEYGGRYTRITSNIRDASEEYTWKLPVMNVNGSREYGWGVDASEWGNALRFANDLGPGTWNIQMNYVPWNGHWHVIYETKTPVLEGEELSVSYGAKYWNRRSRASNLRRIEE